MIVNLLNSTVAGGAAVAALRLHRGLLASEIESRFWHKKMRRNRSANVSDPNVSAIEWPTASSNPVNGFLEHAFNIARKVRQKAAKRRAFRGRKSVFEMFSPPWLHYSTRLNQDLLQSDILHLHWLNGMCDFPSFFASIPDDMPVVWTLHDQNTFTGGCHYADECRSFESGCGSCSQLIGPSENDLSRQGFVAKEGMFTGKNLHIVTPSRWMEREVRKSRLLESARSVQTIYNPLDVNEFSPQDRRAARELLGLPMDKTVIAFGAASLGNQRKGIQKLAEALSYIEDKENIVGLAFGNGVLPETEGTMPQIVNAGYADTLERQVAIYSAADLYVLPSLADNMPQMSVESMACGVPVVAFDVGGVPEVVVPQQTGLLAELRDTPDLAQKIQWMLDHPEQRERMGRQAREHVVEMFATEQQIQKHVELYQRLLQETKCRTAA